MNKLLKRASLSGGACISSPLAEAGWYCSGPGPAMQRKTFSVAPVDLLSLCSSPDSPQQKRLAQWQGPPAPDTFGVLTSCKQLGRAFSRSRPLQPA